MQFVAVSAREWRSRLQELIDLALEQDTLLVYKRRDQPVFFVIPKPMPSIPQQRLEYNRLLAIYNKITQDSIPPVSIDDPLPYLPTNALRRDLNRTLTLLKTRGFPFLLTKYTDVIGFVIPVPIGRGGLTFVRQLASWYIAGGIDDNNDMA